MVAFLEAKKSCLLNAIPFSGSNLSSSSLQQTAKGWDVQKPMDGM
jgi:hypothetical protein